MVTVVVWVVDSSLIAPTKTLVRAMSPITVIPPLVICAAIVSSDVSGSSLYACVMSSPETHVTAMVVI